MTLSFLQEVLAVASGTLVGFTLGVVGGGGSILAVPLLIYVVGVTSPHVAIGTSAVAVAASALVGLLRHAQARTVKWPCAITFAAAGMVGAAAGAAAGKAVPGDSLLALFGLLMIAVGLLTLRGRRDGDNTEVRLTLGNAASLLPALGAIGFAVGFVSGFFGIGGGFLIVPGLISATTMPILNAIGSSLVSVTAFGATTAASYAYSGLVDWWLAALFIAGGILGGLLGVPASRSLAGRGRALTLVFAGIVIVVGAGIAIRGAAALLG